MIWVVGGPKIAIATSPKRYGRNKSRDVRTCSGVREHAWMGCWLGRFEGVWWIEFGVQLCHKLQRFAWMIDWWEYSWNWECVYSHKTGVHNAVRVGLLIANWRIWPDWRKWVMSRGWQISLKGGLSIQHRFGYLREARGGWLADLKWSISKPRWQKRDMLCGRIVRDRF